MSTGTPAQGVGEASAGACGACLRRRWLLASLAGRLERERARIDELLTLEDAPLIRLLGGVDTGDLVGAWRDFDAGTAGQARMDAEAAGLELICRHWSGFPQRLGELTAPPSVLAVKGGAERLAQISAGEVVAVVGTRRPTEAGADLARQLACGLSNAGVAVISGLAVGIDTAAHLGALDGGGATVAVLAGSAGRAYPASRARLYGDIVGAGGVVISELDQPRTWRWALQARNRIIAGLADITVVVEAPERSGSLITARHADALGRQVAAVPGPVSATQSRGPNLLLAKARAGRWALAPDRVVAVRGAQDVLDLLYGEGIVEIAERSRPALGAGEATLLARIGSGPTSVAQLTPADLLALSGLELKGWVGRGPGGALRVVPG